MIEDHFDGSGVAGTRGHHQQCFTIRQCVIGGGAFIEQKFGDLFIAGLCREHQRRNTFPVCKIQIRARFYEVFDDGEIFVIDGPLQRCRLVRFNLIDVCFAAQQICH